MNPLKKYLNILFSIASPPLCLHCNSPLQCLDALFCDTCGELMSLLDTTPRCPRCFSEHYSREQNQCAQCQETPPLFNGSASSFEYEGPPATIVKKMNRCHQPFLAQGAGAYMASQLIMLGWQLPDIIVPVPQSRIHTLKRGYNQAALLANAIGSIIDRPVLDILQRRCGEYSQEHLNKHQRKSITADSIRVKKPIPHHDTTILIVDDVVVTGTTMRCCGEALLREGPRKLYALTFCKAE